jgi:signal transduction histidine kinase
VDGDIRADRMLRGGIVVATLAAVAVAYLFVRARWGTRQLRTELALTEDRSRRHREWALLGAGLAHETKNPLAVVRGLAQRLVEGGGDPADGQRHAGSIVEEVDRVVTRIDAFLQFARPVVPHLEPVDVRQAFEELPRLIETDLAARRGRLTLQAEPLMIRADPRLLRQILLNLLVNAAHAIRDGGSIELRAYAAARGGVCLEVRDDGRGIAAGDIEKVFEPYFTRTPGGTGLGLAIVRRLAEEQGWQVTLESEPERGTTVRITSIAEAAT